MWKEDTAQNLALTEFPSCNHQSAPTAGTETTEMTVQTPESHKKFK